MKHLSELLSHIPDLKGRSILDLGAGRGNFLLGALHEGYRVVGVEPHPGYREQIAQKATTLGVSASVVDAVGEHLPFPDNSFGFLNVNEVFEHVENPNVLLTEMYRVLEPGGYAYLSVPSRFGVYDPHYHLFFINWLPRQIADGMLSVLGKLKTGTRAGRQTLSAMHYKTYRDASHMAADVGFHVDDIRERKLSRMVQPILRVPAQVVYRLFRPVSFDTFHFLLKKPPL